MYGIVTRHAAELEWEGFDRGVYEVKSVDGAVRDPASEGGNLVSCFADAAATSGDPDLAAVAESGDPSTRERPDLEYGYVCPSRHAYRRGLLETVADCADQNPNVRLDDVGFPGASYCYCPVCTERFADSEFEQWMDWRADLIASFVRSAADRVPGRLSVAVHPDPYPGNLLERSGIDLAAIGDAIDELVVPLYDPHYDTTYWLESLAAGFADRVDAFEAVDLGVELYAADVDVDALWEATDAVEPFAATVYFGYDSSTARALLRRKRADANPGRSHG